MRRFANGFNEFRRKLSAACCLAAVLLLSSWSSADPPQPGVIVLNDGRVYTGVLMEVAGGYRVLAAGQRVYAFHLVRCDRVVRAVLARIAAG